ncbi:partial 8-amino-7-oxononanoate synthase, partial [Methylacidimicrobium cyclopophantes]
LPPPAAGAAKAALPLLRSEEGERRRLRLRERIALFGGGSGERPIFPVLYGEAGRAVAASARLKEKGIFAPAIRFPTVPKGKARLRISLCAFHTPEEIRLLRRELEREEEP